MTSGKFFATVSLCGLAMVGTSCGNRAGQERGAELTPMQEAAQYAPRIGVAVRTNSRVCVAIRNNNLAPSSPITLVIATSPQAIVPARIKAQSEEACPITKDLNTAASNYELTLPNGADSLPKLSPMVAVVGEGDGFVQNNLNVQADLDHNGQERQFRACASADGVHLTVWSGTALSSPLLWHGFFYQADSAGAAPTCTSGEMKDV